MRAGTPRCRSRCRPQCCPARTSSKCMQGTRRWTRHSCACTRSTEKRRGWKTRKCCHRSTCRARSTAKGQPASESATRASHISEPGARPLDNVQASVRTSFTCACCRYSRGPLGCAYALGGPLPPVARHLRKVLGQYAPSTVLYAACGVPDCKIHHHGECEGHGAPRAGGRALDTESTGNPRPSADRYPSSVLCTTRA
jgi:hypothetical protein